MEKRPGRIWRTWLPRLAALAPIAIYVASGPLLHLNDDSFQEYFSHGFFRSAMLRDDAFPLWCRFAGGGYPLYAHPHDASTVLPLDAAILVFGEAWGVKINILILWLIGLWGMRRLLLDSAGLRPEDAGLVTALYGLNPILIGTIAGGNYNETLITILPAILACMHRGRASPAWLLPAALMLAALFAFGKFTSLVASLICGIYGLRLSLDRVGGRRPRLVPGVVNLGLLFCMAIGLAALKLLPMLDLLARAKLGEPYDPGPWLGASVAGLPWIGAVACALLLGRLSGRWFWPALLASALAIAAGQRFPVNLGRLAAMLPGFGRSFHEPTKYWLIPAWMLLCLIIGDALLGRVRPWRGRTLWILNVLLAAACSGAMIRTAHGGMERPPSFIEGPFFQVQGRDMPANGLRTRHSNEYYNLLRNVGTIDWYSDQIDLPSAVAPRYFVYAEPGPLKEGAAQAVERSERIVPNPEYSSEVWFEGEAEGIGRLERLEYTANRIEATVEMIEPGAVVLNQNHDPYWMLNGRPSDERRGLLSTGTLPPGTKDLIWTYEPEPWRRGTLISKITLIASILGLGLWEIRRRWARA